MSDEYETGQQPGERFRRTPAPEVGHGELLRDQANRFGAAGARGMDSTALSRFHDRYGVMGSIRLSG